MRQLYSQYVQTRRAQNESTAAITYDALYAVPDAHEAGMASYRRHAATLAV